MPFDLSQYEPVEDRLRAFWSEFPEGRVATELEHVGADGYIVKASVWSDRREKYPVATGYAQEAVTERGVNATSALENCETSAIGRALANLGYAAKGKRPSREEMSKTSGVPAVEKSRGEDGTPDPSAPQPTGHGAGAVGAGSPPGRSFTGGPSGAEKAPDEPGAPAGGQTGSAGSGEAHAGSPLSPTSPGRRTIPANKCDHSVGVDEEGRCMACMKPMGRP